MADEKTMTPDPVPEPTLIQQDGGVPETVTPENAVDQVPEPEAEVVAEPVADQPKVAVKKPWFQTRIDELTKARREAERQASEREAELKLLKAGTVPAADSTVAPAAMTQAEWDRQVNEAADRKLQQQQIQSKSQAWVNNGIKDFGREEFDAKCETLTALGGGDRPEFMAMIVDPDLIPDGHKVVAQLADHPEEAQRILALPPVQMAAALTRFAMTAPAEKKQVSSAPRPITPIGGSSKPSAPQDNEPIDSWMAKRKAEVAARGRH